MQDNNNWFWHIGEPRLFASIKDLVDASTLSFGEMASLLNIPLGTVNNWYWGCNTPRPYILDLIAYYIINEQYIIDPSVMPDGIL